MQFVPDKSSTLVRKVRNNIDRLFDKNLTDLIRGIRNNKENEGRYIASCIEEIKIELRNDSPFIKANAVEKLSYLQMLGYDISWASFNIIEVMASSKFAEKRIGYLAATQSFTDDTDVLMLTTNMIRKDLQSSNMYDVGEALSGMACFATPDLSRDLVNDVVNLLSSSRPYVRKKAVLLLYKLFLKYPESLRPTFPRLKEKLEDPDPGVQSAAVNVICELARKNPKNYLSLAPVFFKLMTSSSNNWMLIKIIKLFGSLVPLEVRLGKKLLEPLTNLINSTSAMSLLYECINTVIAVLVSISNEGPGDYTPSIQLCVQKLGVLIEDSDQNLKYLGLLAMGRILSTHPKAVQAHKDIVMRCLDDKDESIRLRALDLLYGMISKKNIMEIVKKLMEHVDAAEGSFYRDELLSRIISICSHNNYQYITNFEWYISVLVELTKVDGTKHGMSIAEQIQDVTVRVSSIRHFSVSQMALLIDNANLLLAGSSSNICNVLATATWVCEKKQRATSLFISLRHLNNAHAVLEAMIRAKLSIFPGPLISVYVQNIAKLYSRLLCKLEAEDDWDGVDSLDNLVLSKLPEFQYHTEHLEAQERACNLVELLRHVEKCHARREKISEGFAHLFEGELNPVAAKAQRKVPVPEGLDLDAWINEPEPESDEEESGSAESADDDLQLFPTMAAEHPAGKAAPGLAMNGEIAKARGNPSRKAPTPVDEASIEESRRRRKIEQETNPYYMKSSAKDQKDAGRSSRPSKESSSSASGGRTEKSSLVASASAHQRPEQIQSPLEIPGMIGLGRYLQQQDKTISWKQAKEMDVVGGRRGKKAGEELRVGGTKGISQTKSKKRKAKMQNLSALSSSDEGATNNADVQVQKNGGSIGVVCHHVNRGDGEMPDNAISSHGEEEGHQLSSEFKALDMDLDEPLREDERLFIPKTYSQVGTSTSNPYKLPSNGGHTENGFEEDMPKRKPKKKLKAKKSAEEVEGGSSKPDSGEKGKKKRKKVAKAAKSEYTTIESTKTLHNEGDLDQEGGTDEIVSIMGVAAIAAATYDPAQ